MGVVYSKPETRVKETKIIEKRNQLILKALEEGKEIAVCDTNLNPVHEKNVKALVFPKYRNEYTFEIVDFTHIPVETCIERCANRPEGKNFWKGIIMKQKNEFLVPKKQYENPEYWANPNLPLCIIVDLDGTLCIHNGRSAFDFVKCVEDLPNYPLLDIVKMYGEREDVKVVIMSGRPDNYRNESENWLNSYGVKYDHFFMRREGDYRNDAIVKKEIFDAEIKDRYSVYAMFDDRKRVVEQWVEMGLPVFAFGNPYHEF
jgi:hypothetical protein